MGHNLTLQFVDKTPINPFLSRAGSKTLPGSALRKSEYNHATQFI
jgi:hypothetical protein